MTASELFVLNLVRAQAAASAALLLIKLDQELACDALVIKGRPKVRRTYAQAPLKAHLTGPQSALVRAWTPERRRLASSPLEPRLRALSWGEVSLSRHMAGWVAVGGLTVGMAACIWIAATGQWNAAAYAPLGGTATALQLQLSPRSRP